MFQGCGGPHGKGPLDVVAYKACWGPGGIARVRLWGMQGTDIADIVQRFMVMHRRLSPLRRLSRRPRSGGALMPVRAVEQVLDGLQGLREAGHLLLVTGQALSE